MSRLTAQIGYGALSGHERLRDARQAIALARAGLSVANRTATLALAAPLHALEAHGQALLGDARAVRVAGIGLDKVVEGHGSRMMDVRSIRARSFAFS
jgi:hypothetical protein